MLPEVLALAEGPVSRRLPVVTGSYNELVLLRVWGPGARSRSRKFSRSTLVPQNRTTCRRKQTSAWRRLAWRRRRRFSGIWRPIPSNMTPALSSRRWSATGSARGTTRTRQDSRCPPATTKWSRRSSLSRATSMPQMYVISRLTRPSPRCLLLTGIGCSSPPPSSDPTIRQPSTRPTTPRFSRVTRHAWISNPSPRLALRPSWNSPRGSPSYSPSTTASRCSPRTTYRVSNQPFSTSRAPSSPRSNCYPSTPAR